MRSEAVQHFRAVGERRGEALELVAFATEDGHVTEGVLRTPDGAVWYPVLAGVPCFLSGELRPDLGEFAARHGLPWAAPETPRSAASAHATTVATFSDKWRRFRRYGLEPEHREFLFGWYCRKFGLADERDLRAFYRCRERVLEVGPGSGFNTRFIAENCPGDVVALDISEAAYTTYENTRSLANCVAVQGDLMEAPFADESFDLIVADGVLHHTPDTRAAVAALYRKLRPAGQFFFYLYKRMGALRRFADEYIREHFTRLDPEACYAACEAITELGRELGRLNARVTLTKPIDVLGIPAGTHDVQRLVYYNIVKCFWNEAFDFDTNNMVNFDWYHPRHAWQHSPDEVAQWLGEMGVAEWQFNDANPNGISVLLRKPPD
ncbi:MAG TPA: class I SAM-dependent methyltransferase [Stellaceae bacterium]